MSGFFAQHVGSAIRFVFKITSTLIASVNLDDGTEKIRDKLFNVPSVWSFRCLFEHMHEESDPEINIPSPLSPADDLRRFSRLGAFASPM